MIMTDKLTPKSMKGQYDHQYNVFCRKNHDYGNSFEKSLDTFGLVAGIVRMNDKFERLVSLNDPNKDAQIASESLIDTLEDLSNYAAMAACWLKGKKAADWKELRMKELDGNIESIIKNADTTVEKTKDNLHINSTGGTSSVDIKTGKIEFHPKFSGIHLKGPEKLELNLNIPRDKWDEVMAYVHRPDTLPKNPPVKVKYGHVGTFEFPDGITITGGDDREFTVVIDSTRIQKPKVDNTTIIKANNETVAVQLPDGRIVNIDKEQINGKEEVKLEGQNGSSVTFTEDDGIFSFGDGVIARSLGDITLTAEPYKPKEKKKTLNDIRKEHGFDLVNGEEDDR